MTLSDFKSSLTLDQPDASWPPLIKALWYDGKGDWNSAHNIADGFGTPDGDWVHAYLHRKEGDSWNADYWYRRAGQPRPSVSLSEEWEVIVLELLSR